MGWVLFTPIQLIDNRVTPEFAYIYIRGMGEKVFTEGGQELQVNCIDAETLREAQDHPERYQDLLVRIAGYNAIFARLPVAVQEELIKRADNNNI